MLSVSKLDHLVLTVADIPKAITFYTEVLGMAAKAFEPSDGTKRWALTFGDQKINLHKVGAEFKPNARDARSGSADLCFLTDHPIGDWQTALSDKNIKILEGPIKRTGAIGQLYSIYIRDPDGNLIEISNLI